MGLSKVVKQTYCRKKVVNQRKVRGIPKFEKLFTNKNKGQMNTYCSKNGTTQRKVRDISTFDDLFTDDDISQTSISQENIFASPNIKHCCSSSGLSTSSSDVFEKLVSDKCARASNIKSDQALPPSDTSKSSTSWEHFDSMFPHLSAAVSDRICCLKFTPEKCKEMLDLKIVHDSKVDHKICDVFHSIAISSISHNKEVATNMSNVENDIFTSTPFLSSSAKVASLKTSSDLKPGISPVPFDGSRYIFENSDKYETLTEEVLNLELSFASLNSKKSSEVKDISTNEKLMSKSVNKSTAHRKVSVLYDILHKNSFNTKCNMSRKSSFFVRRNNSSLEKVLRASKIFSDKKKKRVAFNIKNLSLSIASINLNNSFRKSGKGYRRSTMTGCSSNRMSLAKCRIIHGTSIEENDRLQVLNFCKQNEPVSLDEFFTESVLSSCKKIGEGVYGEVFVIQPSLDIKAVNTGSHVIKIIPIEGDIQINGEKQKTFEEILSEMALSLELSNLCDGIQSNATSNFVHLFKCWCFKGKYFGGLLQLWDEYNEERESENERPDRFADSQLYIALEFEHAGNDLEKYRFLSAAQAFSVFMQVAYSLAAAEDSLKFEHRDLHWGNVLIKKSEEESISYTIGNCNCSIKSNGLKATIIDFTLSRMTTPACTYFSDLSQDEDLFSAKGDYQFEVYRLMKKATNNEWNKFVPYTNVLWLHYLLVKLTGCQYKKCRTKIHHSNMKKLVMLKKCMLDYESSLDFVMSNIIF